MTSGSIAKSAAPTTPRGDSGPLLFAITCGWMTLDHNFLVRGETGKVRIPATCFLIDHSMGLVLFDTGLGPRFIRPAGTQTSKFIDISDDSSIDKRLMAIGVDPARVDWVINSHLHMPGVMVSCRTPPSSFRMTNGITLPFRTIPLIASANTRLGSRC